MSEIWKSFEFFLPTNLSRRYVRIALRERIVQTAHEGGEFVRRFRVGASEAHDDGWRKWTASYLPGPPGVFRF